MVESSILTGCTLYLDFETKKSIDSNRRKKIENLYNSSLKRREGNFILVKDEYKGRFNDDGFSIKAGNSEELINIAKKIFAIFDLNLSNIENAILKFNFINKCDDDDSILQQLECIKQIIGNTKLMISRVEFLDITTKEELSVLVGIGASNKGLSIEVNTKIKDLDKISEMNIEINDYVKSKLLKNIKKD
ncbi:hypothetical protein [Clostridium perfringens]|uniref:hypothetical protein n=1 Tax=Clostridium perfringens TaxID=1502 RepID=UPI0029035688|nr:hypothetical protein [Clostridium perfringens]MDU2516866.1 hypothetical protein [Clostridium perfringens]